MRCWWSHAVYKALLRCVTSSSLLACATICIQVVQASEGCSVLELHAATYHKASMLQIQNRQHRRPFDDIRYQSRRPDDVSDIKYLYRLQVIHSGTPAISLVLSS